MLLDGLDLLEQVVPALILDPADVDDHVDLFRAVMDGVGRLEAFARGGRIAVREADDRADGELAVHILRRLLDIGCGDADRRGMILHAIITDCLNFRPCRRLAQQRMIAFT